MPIMPENSLRSFLPGPAGMRLDLFSVSFLSVRNVSFSFSCIGVSFDICIIINAKPFREKTLIFGVPRIKLKSSIFRGRNLV